jgi:hypothetical protein
VPDSEWEEIVLKIKISLNNYIMNTLLYMGGFPLTGWAFLILCFGIINSVFYLIYKWATKVISLAKERNDLLRDLIKKMDDKNS